MSTETSRPESNRVGILVGGGPAPGINGTIGAVTLEARNRGHEVVGIYEGFAHLMAGSTDSVKLLEHDDVSRIHFQGGSRRRAKMDSRLSAISWRIRARPGAGTSSS